MATNQQLWRPDTHPETLHTTWEDDPDVQVCVGVHVHPDDAGRHFLATPPELILDGQKHPIPGATLHRTPEGHVTILDLGHCGRIYDAILSENRFKNNSRAVLVEEMPMWMKRQQQAQGQPAWFDENDDSWIKIAEKPTRWMRARDAKVSFDPGKLRALYEVLPQFDPTWKFDVKTGAVSFKVPGLTEEEHVAIQAAVRARHGEQGDLISVG